VFIKTKCIFVCLMGKKEESYHEYLWSNSLFEDFFATLN
jgi:hypothetical protein